jgi:hypothetical protein
MPVATAIPITSPDPTDRSSIEAGWSAGGSPTAWLTVRNV